MDHHDDIELAGVTSGARGGLLTLSILFFLFIAVFLPACSPKIIERVVVHHDTTKVVKLDSVWVFEKDSVFVHEKGDTVFKYVEKIRYRDRFKIDTLYKVSEVHDTTMVEKKVEKELSWVQKAKIGSFWWLLAGLAAALLWIFRRPLLALVRKFI